MKCFFASVECVERKLDPYAVNLVVADPDRKSGSICLAISPKMKKDGIKNRCRMYEIPKNIELVIAKPRMKKYIEYSADIYAVMLKMFSKDDIYVYSIDESFIDVTSYLKLYKTTPIELAKKLMNMIAVEKKIPSSIGIGTNLFLAKIALDIMAKKNKDSIAYLDEDIFKKQLWHHKPITDFWQISYGTQNRLQKKGITDMYGIATCPEEVLYNEFGVNAELLIDHSKGKESCTIQDIKKYKPKSRSNSLSQILFYDYTFDKAKIVLTEMVEKGIQDLITQGVVASVISVKIGYSKDSIASTGNQFTLPMPSNLFSYILPFMENIYLQTTKKDAPIRKITIGFSKLLPEASEGFDFFNTLDHNEKERNLEKSLLEIKKKHGKNSILRATSYLDGATARDRNKMIGGHNSE